MTEDDDLESSTKTLHRMISYLRDEALRLRIMDVAMLLEHAEDAVISFSPPTSRERSHRPSERKGGYAEH